MNARRSLQLLTRALQSAVCGALVALGCGPASPQEELVKNCEKVCAMGHGGCDDGVPASGSVRLCTEMCAEENIKAAQQMGGGCEEDYALLVACTATWSCDDFLMFTAQDEQKCGSEWQDFSTQCPGIVYDHGSSTEGG